MTTIEPTFIFFRRHPESNQDCLALASSMQSFDSVLLLIGLMRYPHALCTCAAAIESAIKSSPIGVALGRSNGLKQLLEVARRESPELAIFPEDRLAEFRNARNRITHDGFSPKDDQQSVGLLLEVGFPFLALCFQHLYSFDLSDAILQEYVHQLRIGASVFQRAKDISGLDQSYCLKSLVHLIRWNLKDNFSAGWEVDALINSEEIGISFDLKYKQRQKLEYAFGASWIFDCPLCDDPDAVVCELDEAKLDIGNIIPQRMVCTNCNFTVGKTQPFLSEALLEDEISRTKKIF
jgi:hypothetical protein